MPAKDQFKYNTEETHNQSKTSRFSQACSGFFSKTAHFTGTEVAPRVGFLATNTALAAAATSPLTLLNAAMQGLHTASSTMTNVIGIAAQALPITGIAEGVIRTGRGAISIALNLASLSNISNWNKELILAALVSNISETAQGSVLLHYGHLALQTGSSATMFHGYFIARAISLLSDIVSLISDMRTLKSSRTDSLQKQQFDKKCLDVLFKTIEVAGWGLLMAGAPIGGIFLVPALMYQLYKGMTTPTPANKAEGSLNKPLDVATGGTPTPVYVR